MLCYAIVCFVFRLHYEINDRSCEDRKIVLVHTGFHVFFTQFPPSYTLYNLQHQNLEIDMGTCGSIVLCHFITCVHMCNHRYQNTELFNHHKGLPHAASLWSHTIPSSSLPSIFHPWQPLICPPSLSFCHLENI